MKLKNTIVAVLMGLLISNLAVANDGVKEVIRVSNTGDMKYAIIANNLEQSSIVKMVDESGNVLFTESTGKEGAFAKVFNLAYLSDGKYKFVVISDGEVFTKPFEIKTTRTIASL